MPYAEYWLPLLICLGVVVLTVAALIAGVVWVFWPEKVVGPHVGSGLDHRDQIRTK